MVSKVEFSKVQEELESIKDVLKKLSSEHQALQTSFSSLQASYKEVIDKLKAKEIAIPKKVIIA